MVLWEGLMDGADAGEFLEVDDFEWLMDIVSPLTPVGGYFCKVMILLGIPSTITKKLLKIKELGAFSGCFW